MSRAPDVLVVGGGVIGAAVAFSLARAGLGVTLLERGELAGQASSVAAGMLVPWSERHEDDPLRRAGLASLELFPALVAELQEATGIDPEWTPAGCFALPLDEWEALELRGRAQQDSAHASVWIDAEEFVRLAPALARGRCAHGALFSPGEAHVRSALLTRAFAAAAVARGAQIETGVAVHGLLRAGSRVRGVRSSAGERPADAVVLCPGSAAAECAAWIGPGARIPVEPVRGQLVVLAPRNPWPTRAILWSHDAYLVPRRDGTLVVGATQERVGFDARVTAGGAAQLLAAACALAPELAQAQLASVAAGLRPDTTDHLPLIGPWPDAPGLVLATGHYRSGVLLAPLTGQLVADGVLGKGWAEPAFSPARFAT